MYTLDQIDRPEFSMDRTRNVEPPEPRLVEPHSMKDLEVWCKEVKRRIEANKEKRRAHLGVLMQSLLVNELDYVQLTGRKDDRGRKIRVHYWQAWMLLSNIVLAYCGRDVGKTTTLKWSIEHRATNFPTGSCILTGSNDDRVTKVWTELIQTSMPQHPYARHFMSEDEGASRVRPPCHRFFTSGFKLYGRPASEQNPRRVESPHAHSVVMDEAQEYSWAAWEKLQPAINPYWETIVHGSMRKMFGVNNEGRIDNVFFHLAFRHAFYRNYRITIPSWNNPDYNLERHVDFLEAYDGSVHSSAFKQMVRGLTGERQRGLVDQTAYNQCCLIGNEVGLTQRKLLRIDRSTWMRYAGDIDGMMAEEGMAPYPGEAEMRVISMDYGGTSPSELGLWAYIVNPTKATDRNRMVWALWARIQMQGIIGHDQAAVVDWLFDNCGIERAAIDSTASTDKIWEILNDPRHGHYAGKNYEHKIFPAASNRMVPIKYQEEEPNKALAPAGARWQKSDIVIMAGWKLTMWALMQHTNVLASQKVGAMIQSHQFALPSKDYELQNELLSVVEKGQENRQPSYVGAGAYSGLHRFSMVRSLALFVHHEIDLKAIQKEILGEDYPEEGWENEEVSAFTRVRMPELSSVSKYA